MATEFLDHTDHSNNDLNNVRNADINGNLDVDGSTTLDATRIDGTLDMNGSIDADTTGTFNFNSSSASNSAFAVATGSGSIALIAGTATADNRYVHLRGDRLYHDSNEQLSVRTAGGTECGRGYGVKSYEDSGTNNAQSITTSLATIAGLDTGNIAVNRTGGFAHVWCDVDTIATVTNTADIDRVIQVRLYYNDGATWRYHPHEINHRPASRTNNVNSSMRHHIGGAFRVAFNRTGNWRFVIRIRTVAGTFNNVAVSALHSNMQTLVFI